MKKTKRFAALLLCLAMAFGAAACGSTADTAAPAEDTAATTSGDGNVAVYATYDMPALSIDPSTNYNNSMPTLLNIYDTLLRYDYTTDSVKYIACDSYEMVDPLTWSFHIREGMTFHDGTPVNAEAVKWSFERTINMGLGAAFIWDAVDSFEVTDEYTLVMHLKYEAPMDLTCCSPYGAYIMSPTAVGDAGEEFFADAVDAGSGPYYVSDRTGDTQIVLSAYEDYWDPWPDNSFQTVVFTQSSETSTRRQMLESGEVDFVSKLPAEDNAALAETDGLTLSQVTSFENLNLLLNTQSGPLQDQKVRQALSYAFPYTDVIDYVMGGEAVQSHGPVPEGLWGNSSDVFQYNYDIDKAKSLLAEAGYPDGGFTLSLLYVSGDETERKCAELFQSELGKLGITVDIKAETSDMFVEDGQNADPSKRPDMSFMWWYPDVPGPYTFLYTFYHSSDPISWNWTYLNDADLDARIDDANILSGTDRDAATAAYIDIQNDVMEQAYSIELFTSVNDRIYASSVGGYVDDPCYSATVFFHDCYRIAE